MGAVDVGEEDYSRLYEELPGDLIEEILAWLPAEYLCSFATVCKQWNALFSSTSFVRRQWAEAPPNKNPWLLMRGVRANQDFWAYSSFTRSWKNYRLPLRLSFPNSTWISSAFRYLGSGAGLFLIQGNITNSQVLDYVYVCNPLTAKYFMLPPLTDVQIAGLGEIGIVEKGEDGYKVLAVRRSYVHQRNIVVIYDSTEKAWTMAGVLPEHLKTFEEVDDMSAGTVFSGGYFYCLMANDEDDEEDGIMGFNMVEGTSIFLPLPDVDQDCTIYFSRLVYCGSRILFVEGRQIARRVQQQMEIEIQHEEEVIIWEFNKDADTKWKEIARMPPTLQPIFNIDLLSNLDEPSQEQFGCVAMGDCLYLKKLTDREVVVYNLTENSWTFLPNYPIHAVPGVTPLIIIAFTPRPNMKVN